MKLYVLIEETGCIDDYQSSIKLVTSKKRDVMQLANIMLENYKIKDGMGYLRGYWVNGLYVDIWQDGKQLDKSIILK